jgi:hypothetical protein
MLLLLLPLLLPLVAALWAGFMLHMPRQVLAQSAAQGFTSRMPLQCESSSHCISTETGKKLT